MAVKEYIKDIIGSWSVRTKKFNNLYHTPKLKILVVGVYLSNRKNLIKHIATEFSASKLHEVTQHWISIGGEPSSAVEKYVTKKVIYEKCAKFTLINEAIAQYSDEFDYYIVCDDDVNLPPGFLDYYISVQHVFKFSLAQPARTKWSYHDWAFVISQESTLARETRFVEIGPVFSFNKELKKLLVPFDESSPMGWGYDLVWPALLEKNNIIMGIIDSAAINHTIRPQTKEYSADKTKKEMKAYLDNNDHLSIDEAMKNLKIYKA